MLQSALGALSGSSSKSKSATATKATTMEHSLTTVRLSYDPCSSKTNIHDRSDIPLYPARRKLLLRNLYTTHYFAGRVVVGSRGEGRLSSNRASKRRCQYWSLNEGIERNGSHPSMRHHPARALPKQVHPVVSDSGPPHAYFPTKSLVRSQESRLLESAVRGLTCTRPSPIARPRVD